MPETTTLTEDGVFSPALIADQLHTHRYELASTLGVKDEALTRTAPIQSKKIQTLLRGMLEILSRVETRTRSLLVAYAWYRGVPIPGFGGMTADRLVREGQIDSVRLYLDQADDGGFVGTVFSAHDPQWAWDPLSGEGARRCGGRFNKKGMSALYTSLTILGALKDATAFGLQLQPTNLCAYEVNIGPIFDATDVANLARKWLSVDDLACPTWRAEMFSRNTPITHSLADELVREGYAGILVRSYARSASESVLNLVLWRYGSALPTKITFVDADGRLSSS